MSKAPTSEAGSVLAGLFRDEWPRLVALAHSIVRDIGAAEQLAGDVVVTALHRWPFDGVPDRPAAWLMAAVRNRALNHLRDRARADRRDRRYAAANAEPADREVPEAASGSAAEDQLALMFGCCHPVLSTEAAVTLTLRVVAGLSIADIAAAFLSSETAIRQRLARAKRALASLRELTLPGPEERLQRLSAVVSVIYVVFTQGHAAPSGPSLTRPNLCEEALRLAHQLAALASDDGEVHALVALIELQAARLATREEGGELVLLENQDRSRWDRSRIAAGLESLTRARVAGSDSPLRWQAEIAACHAVAPDWRSTNWAAICACYDELTRVQPSPIATLNRAIAIAMRDGPERGLDALEAIPPGALDVHHLYWATRADLERRLGRHGQAAEAYRRAIALAENEVEREFLRGRQDALAGDPTP